MAHTHTVCRSSFFDHVHHSLIVKAVPPFHVVHANAAYYRLTAGGNDNVVGAAISSLLSLPNNYGSSPRTTRTLQDDAANHDGTPLGSGSNSKHPLLQVQGDPSLVCLERLVVAGGFGRCHLIQMSASPPKKTIETNNDIDDDKHSNKNDSAAVLSSTPVLLFSATIAPVASDIRVMEQRRQQQQYMSSSLVAGSSNNIMSSGQQHYQPPTTHYVIQLELLVEQIDCVMVNSGGLPASSTITTGTSSSVEEEGHAPPPLGLSKQEVDRLLQPVLVMPTFGNHNGGANSAFTHHIVQA
jgi:hypothetical protein